MISVLNKINVLKSSTRPAIIMCNNNSILNIKSFSEVIQVSEIFENFFRQNIQNNGVCIGLCMEKNMYLPSIIFSLQKLQYAFTYISINDVNNEKFYCHYFLTNSPTNTSVINSEKITEIYIEKDLIILWKVILHHELNSLDNIFCIVRTSGTTGKCKTIKITHNCIEKNVQSIGKYFKVNSTDKIFWGTPLSFDPSLVEFLLAVFNEATLLIVPHKVYINPKSLYSALFNVAQVTILQMVPSIFLRWDQNDVEKIFTNSKLKILAFGGEDFPKSLLKYYKNADLRLFNLYGITEISCWATLYEIKENDCEIPIGYCLEDTLLEVRGKDNEVLESGEGEIFIGSNSRKCFVDDEMEDCVSIFRTTGDVGCIENGNIYYKGRKNRIIKRFGQRVNLSKIEQIVLEECQLISKCIWSDTEQKLLIFILIKSSYTKSMISKILDKTRGKLIQILPQECYPDYFDILQTFPITSHGKIDERKLEEYYLLSLTTSNSNLDLTDLFGKLWCKYLGISNLEQFANYSFFEMGGNSIRVIQLISEFKNLTNIECPALVAAVFEKKFYECKKLLLENDFTKLNKILENCDSKRRKICYNNNLKILWKCDLKACIDGTPLIFFDDCGKVRVAAGSHLNIFAILDENGEEIYRDILTGPIESTPTISSCKRYFYIGCFDGSMHCIDFNTKQIIWTYKTNDRIKCKALLLNDDRHVVFGSYDKHIYCLLSENGNVLWRKEVDGGISANIKHEDKIGLIVSTIQGTCYCLSDKGVFIWSFKCDTPIFGTPCIYSSDKILIPSVFGFVYCLNAFNGNLIWKFNSDSYIFSSLVNYKEYIIFGCLDKNIYILKLTVDNFLLFGKVFLNNEISSTPCVFEESGTTRVLVATNVGSIYLIDFENLSVIQQIDLPEEVFSSPIVHKNKIFIGCRDNNLYCLSLGE